MGTKCKHNVILIYATDGRDWVGARLDNESFLLRVTASAHNPNSQHYNTMLSRAIRELGDNAFSIRIVAREETSIAENIADVFYYKSFTEGRTLNDKPPSRLKRRKS